MILAQDEGCRAGSHEGFDKLPLMNGGEQIIVPRMDVGAYGIIYFYGIHGYAMG